MRNGGTRPTARSLRKNPLRRRSDTVECWTVMLAWIVGVLGACAGALLMAQAMVDVSTTQHHERAEVRATLLTDTRQHGLGAMGSADNTVPASVTWRAHDGSVHRGQAFVEAGRPAGSTVDVWTDRQGDLVAAPMTAAETMFEACGAATLVASGWTLVIAGGAKTVLWRLDRERMRAWAKDWEDFDRSRRQGTR